PFDIAAEVVEIPALVAEERPIRDPRMGLAGLLYLREQAGAVAGRKLRLRDVAHAAMELVELHPHLGGYERPEGARILARAADRARDRGRIVAVPHIEPQHRFRRGNRMI